MSKFTQAIEINWPGYYLYPGEGEAFFSWRACDGCGSTLGGDRVDGHAIHHKTGEMHEVEICVDCVMWLANGDEPENWEG